MKSRQSFCDGTNISPRFQFLTTSFPFQFGFKYEVHSPIFDVNLVLHAPKHLYLSLHIAYPSTRYREPHKHVVFSVIDWKVAAGIQLKLRLNCTRCVRTRQMFPSTLLWRNLKTQQPLVVLDLCLRKTPPGKSRGFPYAIVSKKAPLAKCFASTRKRKASVFKFLRFESSAFVTDLCGWWV